MTHASPETAQEPARGRLTAHGDADTLPAVRPGWCDYCSRRVPKSVRIRGGRFCQASCRTRWWSMARNRGAQLYQQAMIWRSTYGRAGTRGAGMLSRITWQIDEWRRADRGHRDAD